VIKIIYIKKDGKRVSLKREFIRIICLHLQIMIIGQISEYKAYKDLKEAYSARALKLQWAYGDPWDLTGHFS
jgi:hypothetical protein